jgi:hypothetical protein
MIFICPFASLTGTCPSSNTGLHPRYNHSQRLCARISLGKEDDKTETFRWNPEDVNSSRTRLAATRKRVLRGRGVTPFAKRRQRVVRLCD